MKVKPILLNGDMVRAVLAGKKTQTRRPVKNLDLIQYVTDGVPGYEDENGDPHKTVERSPFGQSGDRLYVREAGLLYQTVDYIKKQSGASFSEISDGFYAYRADGYGSVEDFKRHITIMTDCLREAVYVDRDRWRPSIHMPKWAARIWLNVKCVWLERAKDISEEDAISEGIGRENGRWKDYRTGCMKQHYLSDPHDSFRTLWESIYPGSWERNEWVFCCEFEVKA